jgi:acyl-CoA synthetase (AMP-forming)/AMP-acid ligase II
VDEAAVVGRPDRDFGEEVAAFVILRAGAHADEAELISFCRERLAKYEAPKEIHLVGSLPRSPIGKILKKDLRSRLAGPRRGDDAATERPLKSDAARADDSNEGALSRQARTDP